MALLSPFLKEKWNKIFAAKFRAELGSNSTSWIVRFTRAHVVPRLEWVLVVVGMTWHQCLRRDTLLIDYVIRESHMRIFQVEYC